MTSTRTRTYTWDDPAATSGALPTMAGVDALQSLIDGHVPPPPMARTLGFELVEVEVGRAVFEADTAEWLLNPMGGVHGGFAATLLDSALGCAVHSTLPAGTGYTTVDLGVKLVRGITATTGRLRCEARVTHAGGRIATAEATITGPDGKLHAQGTTTCLILRGER
ncbi:MAG TPA: PaaI family thioesterase [Acidimicrobiales bacterium]|nr:PaaI family thioesterase [Acidimicrobiales bacterium]